MLQYAVPNAPQHFQRPSVFAEPPSRPRSTAQHDGFEIARPASTASHHSYESLRQSSINAGGGISGGGLSALAALAAEAPIAPIAVASQGSAEGSTRSSTPSNNTTMATQPAQFSAPASTSANVAPVCQNCQTSTTPLWRRDESGSVLCNACGLFLKLHGRARPISLKTDVIKSRNRVKTAGPKKRDSHGGGEGMVHAANGYPAAHPDLAHAGHHAHPQHHHQHGMPMGMNGEHHRVPSPGSGSNGDSIAHNPNIAPQHIFDTVTLPPDTFASPSLPQFSLRQPSPSAASAMNGSSNNHADHSQSYDALVEQNKQLSTRANELEVINGLYQGRVRELEAHEEETRRQTQSLHAELAAARARIAELEAEDGPMRKRVKTNSDSGDRSDNSTPAVDSGDGTSV